MANLGNLFYTVGLKDMTDSDLQKINNKLAQLGSGVQIDVSSIRKSIEDGLAANPVKITFDPLITSADIEKKLTGQVVKAEIAPLTTSLSANISAALKSAPVNIENFTVSPQSLIDAINKSLTGADFKSVGDSIGASMAKSIKTKFGNETYTANVRINAIKLANSISAAVNPSSGRKLKIDFDAKKEVRDKIVAAISSGISTTITPNITAQSVEEKLRGKVVHAEIVPLQKKLIQGIKDAVNNNPPKVSVGIQEKKLRDLVTNILTNRGYMLTISSINDQFSRQIRTRLNGQGYNVKITCDPNVIARSVQAALMGMSSRVFGLQVSRDILHQSIEDALRGKQFPIQIKVMQDQARQAVQNALNQASNISPTNAKTYKDLKMGEYRAAQAELAKLKAAHMSAADAAGVHARASLSLGGAFGSNIRLAGELGSAMASLYSIHAAKEFLSQVIEIGGELEHQKIALETIYGSGSKMESLYSQIKGLARTSPFGVIDLTKNIKQLSAYGVQYNEVYDTAKRLADISAATSVDINRLILAFGKTKNRTFLDGLEAKQFAYANIPIYDQLSKKLTELEGKFVSVQDVMKRISKKEIGFDMVKEILWDMTDEGGKFYNMQEKLAGSVKTSWKLVKDNIQLMFGEIAESGVGSGLKDMAEILQGLTRNWKTLGAVLGGATVAFGIYKAAIMAHNVVAGKSIAAAAKQHASMKMTHYYSNLAAQSYRSLTVAEEANYLASSGLAKIKGVNVLWSKKLTAEEADALMVKKLLTREDILRLVALKKLTVADAQYVLTTKGMTAADIQEMNAQIARAAAAKRSTVIWKQLQTAGAGLLGTLRSLVFNPFTMIMAGLGAVLSLWSKNNQEAEKFKEIGDNIFSKRMDGFKNLLDIVENIKSPEGLSNLELTQGIEELENAIKDYSNTPLEDINNSLVDQKGHVRSLTERYEELVKSVRNLRDSYRTSFNKSITGALESTDEGWFSDGLVKNAKDYTDALKRVDDRIASFSTNFKSSMVDAVNAATKADESFNKAVAGMTSYDDKLNYLLDNIEKYSTAKDAFNSWLKNHDSADTKIDTDHLLNTKQISAALKELESDTDKFIEDLDTRLKRVNYNPLTDRDALAVQLKEMLNQMEEAGDDAKAIMAKKLEEHYGMAGMIMEDKIGPAMQEKFKKMMSDSTNAGLQAAQMILRYESYEQLTDAQKQAVSKLMEDAKRQVMSDLKLTNKEMADYLARNPLTQLIQLVYTSANDKPTDLERETVQKKGYPGLTPTTQSYMRQWMKSNSVFDARNAAQEAKQKAKSELDAAKAAGIGIEAAQKEWDEVNAALQYLGWTDLETKDRKSNKHTGNKSHGDSVAEQFKQEFKDIKDAWGKFKEWSKSVGQEDAANKIAESGIFSGFSAEDIPRTAEEYRALVEKLRGKLESKGVKGHSQRESLLNEILKTLFDVDKTILDETIQKELAKVEAESIRQLENWNLYEQIKNATGNESLAYTFSFGMEGGETDYVKMIKNQFAEVAKAYDRVASFDDFTSYEQAEAAYGEEFAKAWQEAYDKIAEYRKKERDEVAEMLSEYKTTQDEIAALAAERDRKLKAIADSDRLGGKKETLSAQVQHDFDYRIFQKSGEYLKFFNAILSMTKDEAEEVGRKIRENLDKKLQDGTISAKEYADEIKNIKKQLDKLNNKGTDFQSFMKGGLNKLFQDKYEQSESDFYSASQDYDKYSELFKSAQESGDQAGMDQAKSAMDAASAMKEGASAAMNGAQGAMSTMAVIDTIVHGINDTVQGIKGTFELIQEMAESYGVDVGADTAWGEAGAFLDAFSEASQGATDAWDSLKSGNVGGVIKGVVQSFTAWFTTFNQWHDAKLDAMISKSQAAYDEITNIINAIERRMEYTLGNLRNADIFDVDKAKQQIDEITQSVAEKEDRIAELKGQKRDALNGSAIASGAATLFGGPIIGAAATTVSMIIGGAVALANNAKIKKLSKEINALYEEREAILARIQAYEEGGALAYQRQLMKEQLAELEEQKRLQEDKKNKDDDAIRELDDQIDETRQKIMTFSMEMAEQIYGIDLNSWAESIADALVDAFSQGTDAAEAFEDAVSDIMRSLVSKMISADIIAPLMDDMRTWLFGEDGEGGAYGKDFLVDADNAATLGRMLNDIKSGIANAKELYDAVNEQLGGALDDKETANGLSAGIQSITEDTADLLASYVNAIRASVAHMELDHAATQELLSRMIDSVLPEVTVIARAQLQIQQQIAANTLANAKAAQDIYDLFRKVSNGTSRIHIA